MLAARNLRPIEGAVATLGVSDRVAFLRKTYGLLGLSLIAFALITGGMMSYMSNTSLAFSRWAFHGQWNWIGVLLLFMLVGYVTRWMAFSGKSAGMQLLGLVLGVIAQAIILQPLLWVCIIQFGHISVPMSGDVQFELGDAGRIIIEAAVITLAIFVGLTATVFVTKKDFTFLRGMLVVSTFALLGLILASAIFGFYLGMLWTAVVIVILAGWILYQTSLVLAYFPPQSYVAAALMLFGTVATLFWNVLQLLMQMNRR